MSRILAIKGTEGEREVDYSALSLKEIQKNSRTMKNNMAATPNS